jgi:hypothetical protein
MTDAITAARRALVFTFPFTQRDTVHRRNSMPTGRRLGGVTGLEVAVARRPPML